MDTYGDRLLNARKSKKMTRSELSELCGISTKTIQNYEMGRVTPNRIDVSQRFAEALDISVDYLINGETNNDDLTEEDKTEVLSHASALFAGGKLSEDEQLAFINELQTLYLDAKKRLKDKETN